MGFNEYIRLWGRSIGAGRDQSAPTALSLARDLHPGRDQSGPYALL